MPAKLLQFETVGGEAISQLQERRAIATDDTLIHVNAFTVIAHHRVDINFYLRIDSAHAL
ncbi:hypothetical protein D3C72_2542450 [compost metagenome]